MKAIKLSLPIFVLFTLVSFSIVNAQNEVVENGSFETGDFTGWETQNRFPGGNWYVYSGNTVQGFPVLPPPVGTYAASTAQPQTRLSSQVLFQDLELPNVNSIQCSVVYYYDNNAEVFYTPDTLEVDIDDNNQQARIDIMDPESGEFNVGIGVLENLFQTQPGDPLELGYTTLNFDLTEYAGTTVRFRAAQANNVAPFRFAIDNLTCDAVLTRNIPTLSQWGLIAMAGAMAIAAILVIRKRRFQVS